MEKVIQTPAQPTQPAQPAQPISQPQTPQKSVLKSFSPTKTPRRKSLILLFIGLIVVIAGSVSGWFLSKKGSPNAFSGGPTPIVSEKEAKGSSGMVADEAVFSDTAKGLLVEGGIKGEGTHHLDRDLGEQKYVYLTSSVIDLQSFVGKKVQVWGETLAAQNAGWLMDVGRVKVIE